MENNKKKIKVSYSQFSNFFCCPKRWFLDYPCKLKKYESSINTCFGTAIHEVIQDYIKTLYTVGSEVADSIDLKLKFAEAFLKDLTKNKVKHTDVEFKEFIFDGGDILDEFIKTTNRLKHFPNDRYEFIGVEFPIKADIKNNIEFIGFVDLILKNKETGIYKIFDIKTATMGWNEYMRDDKSKISQLLIYKAFYSRVFNVPLNMIDVEFFILKRKLFENSNFPQSRIQNFVPNHNKVLVMESVNDFIEFVDTCFTPDGEYNRNADYFKNPGKNKKNCKYCNYYKTEHCDGKEEKK